MATGSTTFVFGDKMYDFAKKSVQIYIPAVSSAYFALSSIWGFPSPEKVVGSLAVLATLLGVLLHISSVQYESSGAAYDGTVHLTPTDDGSVMTMNLDPQDLVDKSKVTLKVKSPVPELPEIPVATPEPLKVVEVTKAAKPKKAAKKKSQ
jgi:hypothetical protein